MFRPNVASVFSLVGGLAFLCSCGCSPKVGPVSALLVSSARSRTHSSSIPHVQSLPLYHQAEAACQQKQFLSAARLLAQLAAQPGLSTEERSFVQQQRQICLRDAGVQSTETVAPAPLPISALSKSASADCGPRALVLACQRLGVQTSLAQLRQWAGTTEKGTSLEGLAKAAEKAGLKTEGVQVSREGLQQVEWPAIAWVNERHYIAVLSRQGEGEQASVTIHDPNAAKEETIPMEKLLQLCGGYLLLLHR